MDDADRTSKTINSLAEPLNSADLTQDQLMAAFGLTLAAPPVTAVELYRVDQRTLADVLDPVVVEAAHHGIRVLDGARLVLVTEVTLASDRVDRAHCPRRRRPP